MENNSYDFIDSPSPKVNENLRFVIAFMYGMVYAISMGLLNIQLEKLRSRSKWWKHWIAELEIQRKTPHVFSFLCIWYWFEMFAGHQPVSEIVT